MARPAAGQARYRTESTRSRRLHRRANPLWRQLLRTLLALALLAGLGVILYLGARVVQDWWNRDKLPALGADVPEIGATSFRMRSTAPAPELDGILTIDPSTGVFEFVGDPDGAQADWQVVSPDGETVYVRRDGGEWRTSRPRDLVAIDAGVAAGYLSNSNSVDVVLPGQLRRYVELVEQTTEGAVDNELTRYQLTANLKRFADDVPLEWTEYQRDAVPGITDTEEYEFTIWVDAEHVLARFEDDMSGWSWERLTYIEEPFRTIDPTDSVVNDIALGGLPCRAPGASEQFRTALDSCDDAIAEGRRLTVAAGLADEGETAVADTTFTAVCQAIQSLDAVETTVAAERQQLAVDLHAAGVCPGDVDVLASG